MPFHSEPDPLAQKPPTTTPGYTEFLDRLRRSKLVAPSELEAAVLAVGPAAKDAPQGTELLANHLLQADLLTPWQHRMLLNGRVKRFHLGQYKLLDQIGAGGMGRVYLAEHTLMRRLVAIKVATGHREEDKTRLRRFVLEAKVTAQLNHPHIVKVFHLDREFELYYLVMEYVAGLDLRKYTEREWPLSFGRSARYMIEVADGLAHLHNHGLIHRDIKPANLLVDELDQIKILDLGLARVTEGVHESLTGEQKIVGTLGYIAPEQIRDSRSVDARTDLYGLGATLYFLLTGQAPFQTGNAVERLHQHLNCEPTPIKELRPDAPDRLIHICERLMQKDPAERYQSAEETRTALEHWLRNPHDNSDSTERLSTTMLASARDIPPEIDPDWFARAAAGEAASRTQHDLPRLAYLIDENSLARRELTESLDRMAHGIAHRFNNLLQCILGEVELASLDISAGSRLHESLSRVTDSARRATELTNQLLLMGGKGRCLRTTLPLQELLRPQAPLFAVVLPKNIRLQLEVPSELPLISVDVSLINRLLMSLVINAKEALESRAGTITVRAGVAHPSGHSDQNVLSGWEATTEAFIEVEDNGPGMPDEVRRRAFEPFFSTRAEDRGLGLAVAKGIASQHHGKLEAFSVVGQGTRIRLTLPAEEATSSVMQHPSVSQGSQLAPKVLVVDDEGSIRELVRRTLEHFGFVVTTAEHGEAALEIVRSEGNIDLVLLDLTMPGMDGEAIFQKLRELVPDLPVIVASGSNKSGVLDRLASRGVVEFLQKPFKPMVLVNTVRKVLQDRGEPLRT